MGRLLTRTTGRDCSVRDVGGRGLRRGGGGWRGGSWDWTSRWQSGRGRVGHVRAENAVCKPDLRNPRVTSDVFRDIRLYSLPGCSRSLHRSVEAMIWVSGGNVKTGGAEGVPRDSRCGTRHPSV